MYSPRTERGLADLEDMSDYIPANDYRAKYTSILTSIRRVSRSGREVGWLKAWLKR